MFQMPAVAGGMTGMSCLGAKNFTQVPHIDVGNVIISATITAAHQGLCDEEDGVRIKSQKSSPEVLVLDAHILNIWLAKAIGPPQFISAPSVSCCMPTFKAAFPNSRVRIFYDSSVFGPDSDQERVYWCLLLLLLATLPPEDLFQPCRCCRKC